MKSLPAIYLLVTASATLAEQVVPTMPPRESFTETLAKSPFILETKVDEAPKVEIVDKFKDFYLRGIGKADGKDYVIVQKVGEEKTMRFFGDEPCAEAGGMVLKSVKVGANYRETKAIISLGSETGEVGFSEQTITAAPPPVQIRQPNAPGQFPVPPGTRPGMPMPAGKNGMPPINPAVPRPQFTPSVNLPKPQAAQVAPPGFNSGGAVRTDPNRRIRTTTIRN